MSGTLGERLAIRDERAFVGRRAELERLERLFTDDPPASVAFMHGRGGIGKSTLLRELARRGMRRGWQPRFVEGRELAPTPDALEDALSGVRSDRRPLLLLDSYEWMAGLGGYLRRGLLPSLSEQALIILASRQPPEPDWFREGWEHLTIAVEVGPLSDSEGLELLGAQGVGEELGGREALAWAGGSPLALAVAAEAIRADPGWTRGSAAIRSQMLQGLLARVADAEFDAAHGEALAVAAIARVVTPELLGEVLADSDGPEAFEWLAARTFTEPLGEGIALHEEIRMALRDELCRDDPQHERELRRRIADHLHARMLAGDRLRAIDLAHLIENPAIRWGYSWRGSAHFHLDDVRSGDLERIDRLLAESAYSEHWQGTRRHFEQAPEHVAVTRDPEERVCGYAVALSPESAPPFAYDDPVLGPWLDDAAQRAPAGDAVVWRDLVDLTREPGSGIIAMLGMAGILRSTLENPRFAYLPINPKLPGASEFSAALGARHLEQLDVVSGPLVIECHLVDYGPGGIITAQRDVVYRELGLTPPAASRERRTVDFATVRAALRSLKVPRELAASPLARGETPEERAEAAAALLGEAAERAFGSTDDEQLLRQVLRRGYIDPAGSHELAARELHLSRSAYFRRLRAATARIADYLAQASK